MAHYAKIENGIVIQVIVADADVIQTYDGTWLETSEAPDDPRKNYAGVGYTYDYGMNAFIPPKPEHGSWTLNPETCLWERVE